MIIDSHIHIFKKDVISNREKYFDDLNFYCLFKDTESKTADHASLLKYMKKYGIDYAVAMSFAWSEAKYCEQQNIYSSEVLTLTGGRVIPFGNMPYREDTDVDAWVKSIKDMGLSGIGEIAFYNEGLNKKNASVLRKVLASASEYALPVCLHVNEPVGHKYPGKYDIDYNVLYSLLNEFRDTPVILSHWGGGLIFYELMPEVNKCMKNIYYDTAASPFLYMDTIYGIAVKIAGADRILFGSDYPLINSSRYLDAIDKGITKKSDRLKVKGMNAARVLGL